MNSFPAEIESVGQTIGTLAVADGTGEAKRIVMKKEREIQIIERRAILVGGSLVVQVRRVFECERYLDSRCESSIYTPNLGVYLIAMM